MSFLLISTPLFSQNAFQDYQKIQDDAKGKPMPDLAFEKLINGQKKSLVTQKDLKGEIVILEFWATWCAPCIKHFPKINDLSAAYSDKGVTFISITPESPEIVERFLKRKPLNTWVAVDSDRSVVEYFGVYAYPTTIVIDKEGIVLDYIRPEQLTSAYLDGLLEGKALSVNNTSKRTVLLSNASSGTSEANKNSRKPTYKVIIEEVDSGTPEGGMTGKSMGILKTNGWSLKKTIAFASNISEPLVVGPDSLLSKKFFIDVQLPRGKPELLDELLLDAIQNKFGFKTTSENRQIVTYEMTAPDGISKNLYASKSESGHFSTDDGILAASNWKLNALVSTIEETLGVSVDDQTGLTGKYDFNLYWDHEDPQSIIEAVSSQMGLTLTKKTISQRVVVVSQGKAKKSASPAMIKINKGG